MAAPVHTEAGKMQVNDVLEQQVEAELLARVARQDAEAFSCFYDRTSAVLYSVARSIVQDASMAEDVLQEVYVQIWEKAEVFDPALGKPISWAIALTRNRSLDKLRSAKRREAGTRRLEEARIDETVPPNIEWADRKEIGEAIHAAMRKLEPNKREAIRLAFLQGLPHAEVAETMQQPLGTVKAWIRRGMMELRNELTGVFVA